MTNRTRWGRQEFIVALTARFPEVAGEMMDISEGLLHLEMGDFARCSLKAIEKGDFPSVKEHFRLVDEARVKATDELLNAIVVSYLENVFLGETAPNFMKARTMLSATLQHDLLGLEEHWNRMGEWGNSSRQTSNKD